MCARTINVIIPPPTEPLHATTQQAQFHTTGHVCKDNERYRPQPPTPATPPQSKKGRIPLGR